MKSESGNPNSTNEAPPINFGDREVWKLWVRAGGRCEFDGCNKYLLEDEFTGFQVNLADVAHIVGRKTSARSPRGDDPFPIKERDKAENLMLLCSEHHNKIIDKGELLPEYPKELLKRYKEDHERRIRHVTGFGPDRETAVICMVGRIRGDAATISKEEIRKAVWESNGRYPRYFTAENNIKIDLKHLSEEDDELYWKSGMAIINDVIKREILPAVERDKIDHLSILALARIPFLIYLGHQLGDKVATDIYQKHRVGDEGWVWRKEGETIQFERGLLQKGNDNAKVALVLSISGKILREQLPEHIKEDFYIYEIAPEGVDPNRELVALESTLSAFRTVYQKLLREIERLHKGIKEIHLFPAIPVPIAVVCGRELLKNITPHLHVYDKIGDEYKFTLEVN